MTPESIANAIAAVVTSLGTLVGFASRRRRWRSEIRENLNLIEEINNNSLLKEHTPAVAWLAGKIAVDVAKLSGHPLGTPKKPIPWSNVVFSSILMVGFGYWTYALNGEEFVWYSIFPGVVSGLMLISAFGSFVNREIPPGGESELPDGAQPVRTGGASEEISRSVALRAVGEGDRYADDGQVGVAYSFVVCMKTGAFDDAAQLADANWLLCRIQAWLWNNRNHFGDDLERMATLADEMLQNRGDHNLWGEFASAEVDAFLEAWQNLDPETLGGASRRRIVARDYEVVVLAPVGDSGGYYVNSATIVPGALTFLMRRHEGRWVVASHLATAPPTPGFPPAWWVVGDPSVERLES
ncbi:hypothetical protein [Streptomyces chrestomyceticus]|uniref:hypothetical protein n=1 Tax=Streptomyces chrestomyceticus TaxID=68185 RepID=UPI0019D2BE21|nr:hypothetical protein [Streptomyces chrestomyceticus]